VQHDKKDVWNRRQDGPYQYKGSDFPGDIVQTGQGFREVDLDEIIAEIVADHAGPRKQRDEKDEGTLDAQEIEEGAFIDLHHGNVSQGHQGGALVGHADHVIDGDLKYAETHVDHRHNEEVKERPRGK